jgi:hypothetical protein
MGKFSERMGQPPNLHDFRSLGIRADGSGRFGLIKLALVQALISMASPTLRVPCPFDCAQGRLFAFFIEGRVSRTLAAAKLRRPSAPPPLLRCAGVVSTFPKAHPPAQTAGRACPEQAKRVEGVGQPSTGSEGMASPPHFRLNSHLVPAVTFAVLTRQDLACIYPTETFSHSDALWIRSSSHFFI